MSTSFREFLREKAEQYHADVGDRDQVVAEWQHAVGKLLDQMMAWREEFDPDHVLDVQRGTERVYEPKLGRYTAPRLDIQAFGHWIRIVPKARRGVHLADPRQPSAVGARSTGRVDLADDLFRFVLYRFPSEAGDEWFVDGRLDGEEVTGKPLTRELFERILLSYFR